MVDALLSIADLEAQLDRRLPADRLRGPAPRALIDAARAWSQAVWDAAVASGPASLARSELDAGLAIAQRPVFICGSHRSGTTLVRDLLDGHPALTVLPAEGTFYTNLAPAMARRAPADRLSFIATEWARRLANPINRPPYWLLGRSTTDRSPYVAFARALMAWWRETERRLAHSHPSWPLVAISLAYAQVTGRLGDVTPSHWVEKTPANERFLAGLIAEFPDAAVLHPVRHPFAVMASRKLLDVDATGRFGAFRQALDDLQLSFRLAVAQAAGTPRYCVIRYEDLISDPQSHTERMASAIGIPWAPSLLCPTVAGQPASSNTADGARTERGVIMPAPTHLGVLTRRERAHIVGAVADDARVLGYDLPHSVGARALFGRRSRHA